MATPKNNTFVPVHDWEMMALLDLIHKACLFPMLKTLEGIRYALWVGVFILAVIAGKILFC